MAPPTIAESFSTDLSRVNSADHAELHDWQPERGNDSDGYRPRRHAAGGVAGGHTQQFVRATRQAARSTPRPGRADHAVQRHPGRRAAPHVQVDVYATAVGNYTDTTGNVTSTNGGTGGTSSAQIYRGTVHRAVRRRERKFGRNRGQFRPDGQPVQRLRITRRPSPTPSAATPSRARITPTSPPATSSSTQATLPPTSRLALRRRHLRRPRDQNADGDAGHTYQRRGER